MQENRSPNTAPNAVPRTDTRIDAVAQWRAPLAAATMGILLFESLSGAIIFLMPFSEFSQFNVLVHTVIGVLMLLPVPWYLVQHWWRRRGGNLSHYQLLGYLALVLLVVCMVSGIVVTWQGAAKSRMSESWDLVHLVSSVGACVFIVVHLVMLVVRKANRTELQDSLRSARWALLNRSIVITGGLLTVCVLGTFVHEASNHRKGFGESYNWRFGRDRPFAPSLANLDRSEWYERITKDVVGVLSAQDGESFRSLLMAAKADPSKGLLDPVHRSLSQLQLSESQQTQVQVVLERAASDIQAQGAIDPQTLSGSSSCGTSGCHEQIYDEWLPSAHRYSSLDDMFQRVQTLMVSETSPEHTRYCAGCHDPISLFSGAKNSDNVTLSAVGADEGSSCLVCHSIVQTDVQGNANYTIRPPERYVYEQYDGRLAKFVSDFLIRTYPRQHKESYSRPLYKTAEFCAACHKQYIDKEVNTDIGNVQGQNQYDSWKNSRWYHADDPEKSISCRECHMPLIDSEDPARGDVLDTNRSPNDGKHRTHGMAASNQYMPEYLELENAKAHTQRVEQWLRGETTIPEIAHKWVEGPVVKLQITGPRSVMPGDDVALAVTLTNNKTGHDFPTGPLDMIESWVELTVTDDEGQVIHHRGGLGEDGQVVDADVFFKSDGFDRQGQAIDRHNLWDLVGASYKRTLYPGMTDSVQVRFQCPSMARRRVRHADDKSTPGTRVDSFSFVVPEQDVSGTLHVSAVLWYRKANPEFLHRVYGKSTDMRAPITEMTRSTTQIQVTAKHETPAQ